MKKSIIIGCILIAIIPLLLFTQNNKELHCFKKSYKSIDDSLIFTLESEFIDLDIDEEPFAQMIYCIGFLGKETEKTVAGCVSIDSILKYGTSNTISNTLAACALMQRLGWDVVCFYNKDECYLGINMTDDWYIRRGNWVEKDTKKYYMKEFDLSTPVGSLLTENPALNYISIEPQRINLKPTPRVLSLPPFKGEEFVKKLQWFYKDSLYIVECVIPEEQLLWTRNLPPSLYGMAFSGMLEFQNMGILEPLKLIVGGMSEYDAVNCLYKLCQSESIFVYDKTQPIKGVSQQLIDGQNDCDGRSVFLYALLRQTLGYDVEDIVFLGWPNHIALGLRPGSEETRQRLFMRNAFVCGEYYVLDATYSGDTQWGDKQPRLSNICEILK